MINNTYYLSCTVNTMPADALSTLGAGVSAGMPLSPKAGILHFQHQKSYDFNMFNVIQYVQSSLLLLWQELKRQAPTNFYLKFMRNGISKACVLEYSVLLTYTIFYKTTSHRMDRQYFLSQCVLNSIMPNVWIRRRHSGSRGAVI